MKLFRLYHKEPDSSVSGSEDYLKIGASNVFETVNFGVPI